MILDQLDVKSDEIQHIGPFVIRANLYRRQLR